jgi:hypothetical protein
MVRPFQRPCDSNWEIDWGKEFRTQESVAECPGGCGLIRAGVRANSVKLGLAAPDQTVPYGTVLSRDAFPGTSCRATVGVVPPGGAGKHFATAFNQQPVPLLAVPAEFFLLNPDSCPGGFLQSCCDFFDSLL